MHVVSSSSNFRCIVCTSSFASRSSLVSYMADLEDDANRREDELAALRAIYGDDEVDALGESWTVRLDGGVSLEVLLPLDYPSTSAPTPVLVAPGLGEDEVSRLSTELLSMYDGCEVVFAWIEHLREQISALSLVSALETAALSEAAEAAAEASAVTEATEAADVAEAAEAAEASSRGYTYQPETTRYGQRTRHFDASVCDPTNAVDIVTGAPFHPPNSGASENFQAHVARVSSMAAVEWVLYTLLQDKRIARATHNMVAYRFWDEDRGVLVHDCDDDGESTSGKKLAELLDNMKASNVIVVVSRWFGGQLLGPARFKHIANTARQLLDECGVGERERGGKQTKGGGKSSSKR